MIYLIQYNRKSGTLVGLTEYPPDQRRDAEKTRLNVELDLLDKKISHEVVLLEASSEIELRKTHRRYFEKLEQLLIPAQLLAA